MRTAHSRDWRSEVPCPPKNPDRRDGGVRQGNGVESGANRRNVWQVDEDEWQQFQRWKAEHAGGLASAWTIATHAFPGAHFATFPPALVEPCIKAGTSAKGVCGACGAPWVREVEREFKLRKDAPKQPTPVRNIPENGSRADNMQRDGFHNGGLNNVTTTGWRQTCDCAAPIVPAVVLDPFGGSGTVGLVAQELGRDAILIEISPEYAAIAEARTAGAQPGLVGLGV